MIERIELDEFLCLIMHFVLHLWVLAQKSPGGHDGAARRHIRNHCDSGFAIELPGGEAEPPGDTWGWGTVSLWFWVN